MGEANGLFGIAAVLALGAASPGPSFIMVARTAVSDSRKHGLYAALGMGAGALVFAVAAMFGLQSVLLAVPTLYVVLKIAGGLYLAYLGIKIWRGARQPLSVAPTTEPARTDFRQAALTSFGTQISNPKTAVFYASVFAAFLPANPSAAFFIAVIAVVLVVETGWYALVATLLSAHQPRQTYLRLKIFIDRAAGALMVALGLKLILSARD